MKKTHELLLKLGFHSTYKGYPFLASCLDLALEDENNLLFISKYLYPAVAHKYGTSTCCVERNIRTLINACWSSSRRKLLQNITPYPLDKAPTVGEFIDILYWKIRSEMEEAETSDQKTKDK